MYRPAPTTYAPHAHQPASTLMPARYPPGPTSPLPQRPAPYADGHNGQAAPRLPHRPPTWNAHVASGVSQTPGQYLPGVQTQAPMDLEQDFARMSMAPPQRVPIRAASPAMKMGPPTPTNPWAGQQGDSYGNVNAQYQVCCHFSHTHVNWNGGLAMDPLSCIYRMRQYCLWRFDTVVSPGWIVTTT